MNATDPRQEPLNDLQRQVVHRLADAADAYRRQLRVVARQTVDAIADGLEVGMTREQVASDLAEGMLTARFADVLR